MAPYLLLGFLVAGLLHAFVPPSFFSRHLSGPGFRPVVNSALMGVPLPLCSCGVIPTAMGLRKSGASRGATVSFLISTPQTGVDSILATAATMGLPMALMRPVIAFVTAIFGGSLVSRFCPEPAQAKAVADERRHGFAARIADALHYGFVDMMQDVGKWLTIGLVLAGIIAVAVPDGFLTGLRDYPLLNMLLILVVAVPMYVCATGSIPVAMALSIATVTIFLVVKVLFLGIVLSLVILIPPNNKIIGRNSSKSKSTLKIKSGCNLCVIDLSFLPSGLYRRFRIFTESAHFCGRGLTNTIRSPPVWNFTTPETHY